MKKEIKLFLKFHFTSLSSDAQPILLAIVSDERDVRDYPTLTRPNNPGKKIEGLDNSKSFYAEFSDFDINRCDDWVKGNVISKLHRSGKESISGYHSENMDICKDTEGVMHYLKAWLLQFSDFDIQFVVDCGWFNWSWMVELIAEWDTTSFKGGDPATTLNRRNYKLGLPRLPLNISPVPEDLNDLIARDKNISIREAFDLSREELVREFIDPNNAKHRLQHGEILMIEFLKTINNPLLFEKKKFNALFDAEVIKTIYNKLKS